MLALAFSPDGRTVLSGSEDTTARLWDVSENELRPALASPFTGGHTAALRSVAFSPDGARLASGSHDNTVQLWDAASGAALVLAKHEPGPWLAEARVLPAFLRQVLTRGLDPDPARRFADMDTLLAALAYDPSARRWWIAGATLAIAAASSVPAQTLISASRPSSSPGASTRASQRRVSDQALDSGRCSGLSKPLGWPSSTTVAPSGRAAGSGSSCASVAPTEVSASACGPT